MSEPLAGPAPLEAQVWSALAEITDPEMPVNLVDLGLVYGVEVRGGSVRVYLTFTAMGCPATDLILDDIGHSRVLHGSLRELGTADPGVDGGGYANVAFLDQPWTQWGQFVAANAVLDSAFSLMIEALAKGNVEVLRSRLGKMLQEERYHFLHG